MYIINFVEDVKCDNQKVWIFVNFGGYQSKIKIYKEFNVYLTLEIIFSFQYNFSLFILATKDHFKFLLIFVKFALLKKLILSQRQYLLKYFEFISIEMLMNTIKLIERKILFQNSK